MLHLVSMQDMDALRGIARQAWDVTCPPEFQVDEVVSMRLLEGGG